MAGEIVTKGLEPICGWQWIYQHLHDYDNWTPTIEITRPGSKQTITIRDREAIAEVIKVIQSGKMA